MQTRKIFRLIAVTLLLGVAAACAPYSLVPPAKTEVAGFTVENDIAWNKINQLRLESSAPVGYWTADGPALNGILFIGGVRSGEPILKLSGTEKDATFVFRDSMTPVEVVELWEATLAKLYSTSLADAKNIQPGRFAGLDGFSFDLDYVTKDEVDRRGRGHAAVKDGRLYLIFYSGTRLHHYGLRLPAAERIAQTAKIGS